MVGALNGEVVFIDPLLAFLYVWTSEHYLVLCFALLLGSLVYFVWRRSEQDTGNGESAVHCKTRGNGKAERSG